MRWLLGQQASLSRHTPWCSKLALRPWPRCEKQGARHSRGASEVQSTDTPRSRFLPRIACGPHPLLTRKCELSEIRYLSPPRSASGKIPKTRGRCGRARSPSPFKARPRTGLLLPCRARTGIHEPSTDDGHPTARTRTCRAAPLRHQPTAAAAVLRHAERCLQRSADPCHGRHGRRLGRHERSAPGGASSKRRLRAVATACISSTHGAS